MLDPLAARHERERQGWSVAVAAKKLGVSIPALRSIEKRGGDIPVTTLVKLVVGYDCEFADLLRPNPAWDGKPW